MEPLLNLESFLQMPFYNLEPFLKTIFFLKFGTVFKCGTIFKFGTIFNLYHFFFGIILKWPRRYLARGWTSARSQWLVGPATVEESQQVAERTMFPLLRRRRGGGVQAGLGGGGKVMVTSSQDLPAGNKRVTEIGRASCRERV